MNPFHSSLSSSLAKRGIRHLDARHFVFGLILLTVCLTLPAWGDAPSEQRETLAQADAGKNPEKASSLCNAGGYHCTGRWSDLIDHLFTNAHGTWNIYVAPGFEAEINQKGFCSLSSGKFILINDHDGGERVVLDQLYLSYAMNSKFSLRLYADPATGDCFLHYARTLYNEP